MRTKLFLLVTAASGLGLTSMPAMAQGAGGFDSGEIIVTARKKQESVLNVPVVENVITQEALANYQINDLDDITGHIPGLVAGDAVLAIGVQMSLRGVGSNSLDQGVDQSVTLNIDGMQLSHGMAFRAASFDLAQVEVLKGPQALYFGKNSTAGVISFRSADPGDEVEIKAAVGYEFETDEKRVELIYSAPLSDTVGLRLAGFYSDSTGAWRNRATALPNSSARDPRYVKFGGGESWMARATLLWEPSDDVTVRLKGNVVQDEYRQGGLNTLAYCPDGKEIPPGVTLQTFHPNEDCVYDKTTFAVDLSEDYPGVRNGGSPFLWVDQYFGTLEVDYDIGDSLTFSSVTGFYKNNTDTMINGTFTGYGPASYYADNQFTRRDFTQEVRLDSDFPDSPVNFTVGAYYQDGKMSNGFALVAPFFPLISGTSTIDIESFSVFGQGRWAPTETLEFAAGVRWQDEKRGLRVHDYDHFIFGHLDEVPLAPGSDRISSKNWSPEFTVTYRPTDDFTVFAALKQAYKSGSFIIVIPGNPGDDKHFGDEKVRGGEVGIKSRLFDRALSLDIAGYYYEYSGLQTGVNEPSQEGLPILRTVNAGKARIHGVDFEAHYRPPSVDGLSLNLAVNWNKSKFVELNNVPCYGGQTVALGCDQFWRALPEVSQEYTQSNPGPGAIVDPSGQTSLLGRYTSQNLKGVPFVRAPEWQINFGFDYEMPVGDDMRLVFVNANRYSSSYTTILGNPKARPATLQPKALKIDANLTLYGPDDRWSIGVFGKNLTDKLRPG
ncbi:MAG: TonB-dependent receptor, partial [Novosphingobium sp.]|nr:TonB-dependent receptor [Novosphingobium sp.]